MAGKLAQMEIYDYEQEVQADDTRVWGNDFEWESSRRASRLDQSKQAQARNLQSSSTDLSSNQMTSRRQVQITGHPSDQRVVRATFGRSARSFDQRLAARPDRLAGWAFGLGMFLVLVSVTTANACPV